MYLDEMKYFLKCIKNNNIIYTCGNGGSSSLADHFTCDFIKQTNNQTNLKVKSISLASNFSLISAIANDISYEEIFSFQIEKLCKDLNLKVEFEKFGDHSIFLKIKLGTMQNNTELINNLKIEEWFSSIIKSIKSVENEVLNDKIKELILVGASHISQYPLLMSKIIEEKTLYVLDNSKSKHDHRLYGTKIVCKPFEIIKGYQNPKIVIFNSPYLIIVDSYEIVIFPKCSIY